MRYKLLGRSGLRVSEVALGTQTFGTDWGWGSDREASRAVFEAFAEAGGNFIDTANIYTDGNSERYLGDFIAADRDRFVLATKYSGAVGAYSADVGAGERHAVQRTVDADVGRSGNSRKSMVRAVEGSLRRLGTDYIDLFYLHFWDFTTGIDEVMRGLDDLVRSGKVLYVAFSDTPAWITAQAALLADLRGWAPLVAIQTQYSLVERTSERELLPMARALDLAVIPWSPLGGGVLSGKYVSGGGGADDGARFNASDVPAEQLRIAQEVGAIAGEIGVSSARVALAWMRQQADRWGVVVPLLGARTVAQLQDNLGSLETELTVEQLARLDAVSAFDLGFPHTMLESDLNRALRTSGKYDLIDNHRL
jgi:aryl-alcohol dehydrogenase-like predicted oxidoreductase